MLNFRYLYATLDIYIYVKL